MRLEPVYEGINFSVYQVPVKSGIEVFPEITPEKVKELELSKWSLQESFTPSYRVGDELYGDPKVSCYEVGGVELDNPGWAAKGEMWIRTKYPCDEVKLFKVPEAPIKLSLNSTLLKGPVGLMYTINPLARNADKRVHIHQLDLDELAWLDRWGVVPEELIWNESIKKFKATIIQQNAPVGLWLNKDIPCFLPSLQDGSLGISKQEWLEFSELTTPLFIKDVENIRWFGNAKDGYWAIPGSLRFPPSEVEKRFGVKTNREFQLSIISPLNAASYRFIPLKFISEVDSKGPIQCVFCPRRQEWVMKPANQVDLREKFNRIVVREVIPDVWLVPEDPEWRKQCLEELNIIKLDRRTLAGGRDFKLWNFAEGDLPGRYAWKSDTYRGSYRSKKELKRYEELEQELTHKPPRGRLQDWKIEDLIRYDELCRSGNYSPRRLMRLGNTTVNVDGRMYECYNRVAKAVEFKTEVAGKGTHTLYQIVDFKDIVKEIYNTDINMLTRLGDKEIQDGAVTLLKLQFPPEWVAEWLGSYYQLPEVEKISVGLEIAAAIEEVNSAYSNRANSNSP